MTLAAPDASIRYWRWYTNDLGNNPGEDMWRVQVTTDGVNWTSLENTTESDTAWQQKSFALADYYAEPGLVQLRFIADDAGSGSLVEAAVDGAEAGGALPAEAVAVLHPAHKRGALPGYVSRPLEQKPGNPMQATAKELIGDARRRAIAAHPDDVEITCGGTLLKMAAQGYARFGLGQIPMTEAIDDHQSTRR